MLGSFQENITYCSLTLNVILILKPEETEVMVVLNVDVDAEAKEN